MSSQMDTWLGRVLFQFPLKRLNDQAKIGKDQNKEEQNPEVWWRG